MANLSDAFGTITVNKVGKEFLTFMNKVQGKDTDAYYQLMDVEDFADARPDKQGNLTMSFNTFGRWNYGSNIEGYLDGTWMDSKDDNKKAYKKFTNAVLKKDGAVIVEYTDSDACMDWMGTGTAELSVVDGEVRFTDDFNEESVSVKRYAELYQYDNEIEAMESLHGDEATDAYIKYLDELKGKKPLSADDWYDNEYEQE